MSVPVFLVDKFNRPIHRSRQSESSVLYCFCVSGIPTNDITINATKPDIDVSSARQNIIPRKQTAMTTKSGQMDGEQPPPDIIYQTRHSLIDSCGEYYSTNYS